MAEFSFTPDVETPEIDSSEFSFTPDENQETAKINVKNYNGTSLVGEPGEDAKPYNKMDLFLKNLFTFDVKSGEEVKERQQNNPRIQALEKVKQEGFDDVKWGEVGKSLVKGSLELGKSMTASPFKIYGDWSMDERDTSLMTPKEADEVKFNNFRAQSYVKFGEYIGKIWDMGINADWLKEDEETFKGTFVENPSMTRVLSLGASAIPSVTVFGLTSKITGSRKAASVLLAGADNDDLYFEAREAGESQNKALALFATGTAGTAALEKYGFDQIFNQRVTAPFAKRVRNAVLAEGFTEGFQTGYQNAVKKYGYDDTQELLEGVLESVIAGALSGGAISTADAGYVKLQNARGKLKDKGATDEVLDKMQEEFARELSYHRETIEPMFQTKITESLNNLDKFVKEHEGTAEAQKALKTKAELDEVYNLVNKSLTDNGVNAEVANADAKVWQGIALWGSQETGLSPMEYINQRMPKVQQKRLAEFLNEREKRVATSNESELEILRQDINRLKKGVSRKASKGLRLSQFIKKMGGINDDRGDIKAMGSSVGLLNKNGISFDEATQMAWDAGYIQSTERPDVNQLLDLLSDDLGNKPVYSFNDNTKDDNRQYYLELERALDQAGADINKDSLEVINQKLNDYKNSFAREDVAQYNPELDDFIPFQGGVSGIELSGKELGNYQDANDLRRKAYKYFQDNLQGKYATHPVLGKIKFIRRGINKVKSTSADIDKLKLVPKIKEIIEGAEYLRSETPNKPHDGIVKFHYLSNSVMLEGNNISVFISIAEDNEGNFFYNINKDKNQPSQDTAVQMRSGEGVVDNSAINVNISPNRENVNKTFYQESLNIAQENAELDKVNPKYEGETINIDGVERTVYNSNGDRIAMSEPALRNFYRWFGDSKVVDKQGRPLVVYHGTSDKIDVFLKEKRGELTEAKSAKEGFWFTDGKYTAETYARYSAENSGIKKLEKQQKIAERQHNWEEYDRLTEEIEKLALDGAEKEPIVMPVYLRAENVNTFDAKNKTFMNIQDKINDLLENSKDKDGIIIYNLKDAVEYVDVESATHIMVKEPNQIKSTSNRGTYSESDNIYYQFGGVGAETAVLDKLEMAKRAEEYGYSNEEIWNEYGWIRGEDGKWRFEISDEDAFVNTHIFNNKKYVLEDVLVHDKLYEAYPIIANVETFVDEDLKGTPTMAAIVYSHYDKYNNPTALPFKLKINPDALSKKGDELKSILLHEVQHIIQRLEGFATGGNPNFFRENKEAFQQAFKDMANKKYKKALYDELYSKVEVALGDEILDADEKSLKASKEWMKFVFDNNGDENSPEALKLEDNYDNAKEHLRKTLEQANLTTDDFAEIKKKAREKAGMDAFYRVNDIKHYDEYDLYKRLYGEIEARNTQARMNMSESERRATLPETTQDFSNDEAIVVFGDGTVMAFESEVIQKFYQDAGRPKGAFAQNLDQKGVIYLFEDADASTFMHETAHFFRKELEEFGTTRSKEMLQKMVEWENSEFDKRYNVQQTANGFVVTDKLGNVVYGDKKPFQSVQSAREYGRNEIFARGFEQYLRDGKAPSNYLKQAFRSFWSWLRSLYKSAKDLNVEINDNIRSVYNEIIGGADLDFYLSAPVDEVLQQRVAESKDREEYLEDVIKRAQAKPYKGVTGWVKEKTESNKGLVKWWNAAIVPISTRAKRVNIKLRNRLRAYDYAVNNKYNEYMAQVKPFLDKWEKFSEQDTIAFDLALKNSYMKKQIDIVNKYGAYEEFVQVKNLLNRLFDQAIDVGVELGYTADYFPRQVEDVDGFMAYLHGSAMASQMRRALKDADPTNTFTNEEKAEFINKYLRGFNRKDLNKPLPGNTKDRIIDVITPEMNKYYKPSIQALISYIDGMNQSIESRRFWGFEYESINDSIGSLTSYLVDTGVIQPEQDAEVQEILKARFKAKGVTNKYLKKQKNLSYIYLMGGINSAITQIEDISVAIYKAGFWNTATSVFSKNRVGLSREELGLEKIGQEFVEASTSSKAVSRVFKLTGLDKIDAFGKNTLINATFNKFQDMANKDEDALRARLEPILEQETNQTIQDIKNGEISENVKLLMFNELADMQPISLSEMPEWYLTSGNGRVFYMLKTFALKRIDIFRNECFDKIRQGDVKTGIQNLFRLSMLMILCGMSKDAIINMLYGRDMELSESFINNLLGLTGFMSKYSLYKARDEGFSGFLSSVAIPPLLAPSSDLIGDIYKSLFSKKGKDISDYEIWKGLPLIGRFYYWWLGGGRTKIEKKKNKKLK